MKGMCGWHGGDGDPVVARKITDAMKNAIAVSRRDSIHLLCGFREGVVVWSEVEPSSSHEIGPLKVAIVGNAYWKINELNALAREQGIFEIRKGFP